jgi:UDP-N-acetylmuramyl tripeptide synthase
MGGAARHNIRNALGAMALCQVLGAPLAALREGLARFQCDPHDNPGRGNWFEVSGARILVDFAHNEHGLLALTEMLAGMPAKRRIILLSQAGDRPDRDIATMTRVACTLEPQRLLVCDLPGYERGRQAGAVPAVITAAAVSSGVAAQNIETFASPLEAARSALADLQAGDLVILLALSQRDKVLEEIQRLQG